jgi:hypothetical protein
MPIDTRIPLGIRPIEMPNPLQQAGQVMQMQSMMQRNRLTDLMMQDKAREVEQENALSQLYRDAINAEGKVDRTKVLSGAAQGGLGAKIPALQKGFADQDRAAADAQKSRLESGIKQLEIVGQVAGSVRDPLSFAAANEQLMQMGIPPLGDSYDPAKLQQISAMALSRKDQLEQQWKAMGHQLDVAKFGYQQQNDAANRSVTIRGQNLTDARGREFNKLKEQENQINQQGIVGKKVQEVELKLQDDYRTESKGFSETATAMKKVLGSIDAADKNPGSALAAGTAFMKLLDPYSVVRETELGMALNASGWFDRAMNIANTLQAGKVMTPKQKENLKKASEVLFEEAKAAQREIDAAYEQRAKAYGADPSRVIVDRGQKVSGKPAPAAGGLTQEEMQELAELRKALGRK